MTCPSAFVTANQMSMPVIGLVYKFGLTNEPFVVKSNQRDGQSRLTKSSQYLTAYIMHSVVYTEKIKNGKSTAEEIEKALEVAIEAGYRHIDTAFVYGNESAIGQTLKKFMDDGKVKREDLFIVTKLPLIGNREEDVKYFLMKSLSALQLDYVDLYLIHVPVGMLRNGDDIMPRDENGKLLIDFSTDLILLWKAMEAQVDAGRAKCIGLSNFNINQIQRILDNCRIRPHNLQVELHIYLQQKELVTFCKDKSITVCAYSPLGSPGLKIFSETLGCKVRDLSPMNDPVILKIAKKYNKLPSQVLLRFLIQYGVAAIPKSTNPERIRSNIDIFDFEITEEEFNTISSLDRGEEGRLIGGRGNEGLMNWFEDHPEYPFPK